jgi:hypothetical protein
LLAAGVLAFLLLFSGHAGHARDPLSGDVQAVDMIGFTVADIDREADFFTKVLQFEKVSDFRVVGSDELWPKLGDGSVRKAAYRGGWKPA